MPGLSSKYESFAECASALRSRGSPVRSAAIMSFVPRNGTLCSGSVR